MDKVLIDGKEIRLNQNGIKGKKNNDGKFEKKKKSEPDQK
jgi:hypothetical protein